ncbi:MAG: biotin--[acetyl-CoA-carboxylase] ligase [Clostridia bacterium]|nr:biotin--[acetyl-CoA-carboxylase] ligase [Clostridia bacterium]
MKIELLEETTSTNDYIKRYLNGEENIIVSTKRQTGGKGTKGRSFLSGEGGVYLSALTFYKNFPAGDAFRVMAHAAVAVCKTAERFGVSPEIKWANDVFADGRKLAGILIENVFRGANLHASIVGIGLNAENDVSALGGIAVSLSELAGTSISADEARQALIEEYQQESSFEEYLARVRFLGRTVRVTEGEREYFATAREILGDGRLLIEEDGKLRALSAAEISIKT